MAKITKEDAMIIGAMIQQLMDDKFDGHTFMLIVPEVEERHWVFTGSACPVCCGEGLSKFVRENKIPHLEDTENNEKEKEDAAFLNVTGKETKH